VEGGEGHYSLCAQFEDSAVSHSMYEWTEMFKKGQTCMTDAEYTGHSLDVNEKLNCRRHRSQR